MVLDDVLGVDLGLRLIVRLQPDRPREVLVLGAPLGGSGGDKDVRHLLLVEVGPGRGIDRGAQLADDRKNLVLIHELVRQRHRLGRIVCVVVDDVLDLPAVDAASCVDVGVIGVGAFAHRRVERSRPAQRRRRPDRDRVAGDPGVVLGRRGLALGDAAGHTREKPSGGDRQG